jgi:dipeptidyl aminopeptidase/acylaminoacyl peptidase
VARVPNLDDLAALRSISDVRVAPGGERIAYVVTEPDPVKSTIWIDDRPVAEGRAPRWRPDGSLAFVRDKDIRILPAGIGESQVHLTVETGIVEHAWSPDGSSVAYTSIAETPEPDAPIVIDQLFFKLDGFGRFVGRTIDLFVDGERLTTAGALIGTPVWTADGAHILFSAGLHADRDLDGASDLFRIAVDAPGEIERLTSWAGIVGTPVIDGDRIVFIGQSEAHPMLMNRIWQVDDKPTELFPDLDRNVLAGGTGYPGAPLQSDGRGGLVFVLRDHGFAPLVRVHGDTPTKLVDGVVTSASVDPASGVVAAVVTTLDRPEEIVVTSLDGAELRRITSFHDDLVAEWTVVPNEERWFTAPDGTRLQGWLRMPATTPAPLFVDIHGGPHNAWSPVFDGAHLNHHALVERGWAVLTLNPRASDGYGQAFWAGTGGDWGLADEQDFHAAIDALIADGTVDPDRVSIGGYSYGGYMTAWLVGRSDRFRAAIAGGVVSDAASMHGASDVAGLSLWREWNGRPWDDPETYRARSPMMYVDGVTTPTLVLHGEADTRCPVGEAERFFTALRARGVTTQLVLYPGQAHVFIINGPLAHRRDYQQRVVDWLVEHGG